MANNFRITGDYYVSKAGHDSNDGLTPDSPKRNITTVTDKNIVVGAGSYNEKFVFSNNNKIIADGYVIINNVSLNTLKGAEGIVFSNCGTTFGSVVPPNRVTIINPTSLSLIGIGEVSECIFTNIDVSVRLLNTGFSKCIFDNFDPIGKTTQNVRVIRDSYISKGSIIPFFHTNFDPSNWTNNNFRGLLKDLSTGKKYAIQGDLIGTPQDNGYDIGVNWISAAQLLSDGSSLSETQRGQFETALYTNINLDPKFNNIEKLDFTLQADSPHIGRASDGFSNIGGTEYAQSFYAGISNPNILLFEASEAVDTTTNNNDWRLKPGYNEGVIRAVIRVSNTDVQISSIPYIGNYAFDSDVAGGDSQNINVPDSKPVTNEYPNYLQTTAQAENDTTLIIENHGASTGQWLWVDGQYREITGIPDANTITLATSLRAIVVVETIVKIGTFEALASLNPNRLNMKMRSSRLSDVNSSNWDIPLTWDNDNLATPGEYLAQEWNSEPLVDVLNQVGFGDDNYDANYGNPINLKVVDILIYLRNNYKS